MKITSLIILMNATFILVTSITSQGPVTSSSLTTQGNVSCGVPPAVSAATSVFVRDVVTYTCNSGYVLAGSSNNVTCLYGKWIGELPVCNVQNKVISMTSIPKIFNELQSG